MKNAEKLFCNSQEWSSTHNTGTSFAWCGESSLNTSGSVTSLQQSSPQASWLLTLWNVLAQQSRG